MVPAQIFHSWLIADFSFFLQAQVLDSPCAQLSPGAFSTVAQGRKTNSLIPTTVFRWNISRNKTSLCCPSQESEQHWALLECLQNIAILRIITVLPVRDKKCPQKFCQGSVKEGFSGTRTCCRAVCFQGQITLMVAGHSWEDSSQDLYVLVQWNQLKSIGLYTNTSNSWQFHLFFPTVLGSGSPLGCYRWAGILAFSGRSRTVLCFQPLALWCQGLRPQLWAQLVAEGSGVRRELRDCCSCSEHECVFSRAKGYFFASGSCFNTGCVAWSCQKRCSSSWCAFEVGLKPAALLTPPKQKVIPGAWITESWDQCEIRNKGVGDVWQRCWLVGMFTEQQERTESRSCCCRQHLTALAGHRCGAAVTPVRAAAKRFLWSLESWECPSRRPPSCRLSLKLCHLLLTQTWLWCWVRTSPGQVKPASLNTCGLSLCWNPGTSNTNM